MAEILWSPSPQRIEAANLTAFLRRVEQEHGVFLPDYDHAWRWSIEHMEAFWRQVWSACRVIGDGPGEPGLIDGDKLPGARFFPHARLNLAENLLRRRDDGNALVFWAEDKVRRRLTWRELRDSVARLAQALRADGVGPGDRVAGFMPNMPEAIIAMLAATALGAVWSSCSPDFGEQGVLDRFGQIRPKVLFCADGYYYGGKTIQTLAKTAGFARQLEGLERIIVAPLIGDRATEPQPAGSVDWNTYLAPYAPGEIAYQRMAFGDPLYILYSSGTTGKPKCIVHGIGGTLLQHLKEHQLLCDIKPGDRVFYFTTCGWMMWNWLVTALASEATLLLYDGSPFAPSPAVLFDFAAAEKCTLFGTSAKYIDAIRKAELAPARTHDLSALRLVTSTGSPLAPEGFDYVYRNIKSDVCLSSISGGTDIVSCFMGGNPIGPVRRGEIQARGLGMAVEVWDDHGQPVVGQKGELVCVKPFPSMPVGFWNDPDGARYRAAYFERYPGVWHHGDYVELRPEGGVVVYGRSDATLNPGGVRIGTAEIYRQVEQLAEIEEALVIGQDWEGDVRVVLFVRMRPGYALDDALIARIKAHIRAGCTPRHVPAKVIAVPEIPRTKSGKIVELAVRDMVHGQVVKNREALANPEALEHFRDLPALRD